MHLEKGFGLKKNHVHGSCRRFTLMVLWFCALFVSGDDVMAHRPLHVLVFVSGCHGIPRWRVPLTNSTL